MSEEEWIEKHDRGGDGEFLRHLYRSVIADLRDTAGRRMHDHATGIAEGWPIEADWGYAIAHVIRAAIRHGQEMARDSRMAETRRTKTKSELIAVLREFQRVDAAFVDWHRSRKRPTKKQQAARDAYLRRREADRSLGRTRLSKDEITGAIDRSPNVVRIRQRRKLEDEEPA